MEVWRVPRLKIISAPECLTITLCSAVKIIYYNNYDFASFTPSEEEEREKERKELITKYLWTDVIDNWNKDDAVHTSKSKVKSSCQRAKPKDWCTHFFWQLASLFILETIWRFDVTVWLACLKSGINLLNETLTSESDYQVQDLENQDQKPLSKILEYLTNG